jgi:16S rRNA (cytosine967-C5)-methyltransferase
VIAASLAGASNFKIVPVRAELQRLRESGELVWANIDELISGDFLRTIPGVHPCDGFFAAVIERY